MGIAANAAKCLFLACRNGVSLKKVVTLGRQHFFMKDAALKAMAAAYNQPLGNLRFTDAFSEPFFTALGAEAVDSIDFSDYEGATILHDMNQPIPDSLKERYDTVFDGGTLEHVFNFPQAIKNCMQLIKPGGCFLSVTPANNQMGHGFYQFSPELFYRIFSKENGFEVIKIFVCADPKSNTFYEVKDPGKVKSRVTLTNSTATDMIVMAQRIAVKEIFAVTPQQSDYAATWHHSAETAGQVPLPKGGLVGLYRKLIPVSIRDRIWRIRYGLQNRKRRTGDLGNLHPDHFVRQQ